MRLRALVPVLVLLLGIGAPAFGRVALNSDATGGMRDAQAESSKGQKAKALSMLESQLMNSGVTVGLQTADWSHAEAVRSALGVWKDALGSDSPFSLSTADKRPDVLIQFVDTLQSEGDIQGKVDIERQFFWGGRNHGYRLVGTVYVCKNTEGGRPLTDAEVSEVVAHELGHVLGLDDNDRTEGLMGPFVPGEPRVRPSEDEVAIVQGYRADLRDAIARIREAARL